MELNSSGCAYEFLFWFIVYFGVPWRPSASSSEKLSIFSIWFYYKGWLQFCLLSSSCLSSSFHLALFVLRCFRSSSRLSDCWFWDGCTYSGKAVDWLNSAGWYYSSALNYYNFLDSIDMLSTVPFEKLLLSRACCFIELKLGLPTTWQTGASDSSMVLIFIMSF